MHQIYRQHHQLQPSSSELLQEQPPGDFLFLSMAATDLISLRNALAGSPQAPFTVRAANPNWLDPTKKLPHWCQRMLPQAKLVIIRLLGGYHAWPQGSDLLSEACREYKVPVIFLSGDDGSGASELEALSSVRGSWYLACKRLLAEGGIDNYRLLLQLLQAWQQGNPCPELTVATVANNQFIPGKLHPQSARETPSAPQPEAARVLILGYRAWLLAGDNQHVQLLQQHLQAAGIIADILYIAGLRDPAARTAISDWCKGREHVVIASCLGFASEAGFVTSLGVMWIQLPISGSDRDKWHADPQGLSPSDLIMQVSMPEFDARLAGRCIAFRNRGDLDTLLACPLARIEPDQAAISATVRYLGNWLRLQRLNNNEKRIATVLANYPSSEGRIANGVGLDTPQSVVNWLQRLRADGYQLAATPATGNELISELCQGPTNSNPQQGHSTAVLAADRYGELFSALPADLQQRVTQRWGKFQADRFYRDTAKPAELAIQQDDSAASTASNRTSRAAVDSNAAPDAAANNGQFVLPIKLYGKIAIGIQPTRGWDIDPDAAVHDPALVPTHGYIAFYFWLRNHFSADALVHFGKHGSLEWLPGKATGLSAECWPQVLLADLPLLYPFIVNDPGEGSQAKRRNAAVIIDHLTPPPVQAGAQPQYARLERLLDEYAEAQHVDPRRNSLIRRQILELTRQLRLDHDLEFAAKGSNADDEINETQLQQLDQFICSLKELQIRDGLHIFGQAACNSNFAESLLLFGKIPAGNRESLLSALCAEFELGFDPLAEDLEQQGRLSSKLAQPLPEQLKPFVPEKVTTIKIKHALAAITGYAIACIAETAQLPQHAKRSKAALHQLQHELAPQLHASYQNEAANLQAALAGRFVPPGPAGAVSRGRWDVLPTGRNFYAADPRALPTPAAVTLGRAAVAAMLKLHLERAGDYPRAVAISAWGTSAIRTGGDDIAMALAYVGAEPQYDSNTGRILGFTIVPREQMQHPRIDVTLRVSGFFRDAFPQLMDLFAAVVEAIAALPEDDEFNPIRAHVRSDQLRLQQAGMTATLAYRLASTRVFSSKPQSFGAGINSLIDSGNWRDRSELGKLFIAWGGYGYGGDRRGESAQQALEANLGRNQAIIHNQDNREHDILDSDDYYQFAGGLTAAVATIKGSESTVYHHDHSNPAVPRSDLLAKEIIRVVRGRACNPRWLTGIMRHGYKGAAEMAATLDYLFAFSATTHLVPHHAFDLVYASWIDDAKINDFLQQNNPQAYQDILQRLAEAWRRGLWHPRSNHVIARLSERQPNSKQLAATNR